MSEGRVWHIGCQGEFVYSLDEEPRWNGWICNCCGLQWDGLQKEVTEYRKPEDRVKP